MRKRLYNLDAFGDKRVWEVQIEPSEDEPGYRLTTKWGLAGGSIQETSRIISQGKQNRSAYEQALLEANSDISKKEDDGYTEDSSGIAIPKEAPFPMLAYPFEKHKHKISYPAIIQPKLDGLRCIAVCNADREISCWSRKGKRFETTDNVERELAKFMKPGQMLDGELYRHGADFNELSGEIRNASKNDSAAVYHIFDSISGQPQYVRLQELLSISDSYEHVKRVLTTGIKSEEEAYSMAQRFVEEGYEGAVVRTLQNPYRQKYRSMQMLKVKFFQDEEFLIVGYTCGEGKEDGAVIWHCATNGGKIFNVRPMGTIDDRKRIYADCLIRGNQEHYIGQLLTVKYFGLSRDGIPRFPVGLRIRR